MSSTLTLVAAWKHTRLPVVQLATITVEYLYARPEGGTAITPPDVRFPYDWAQGHVPVALHVPLGDLLGESDSLSMDSPYAAMCAAGTGALHFGQCPGARRAERR